jgi:hypothetical protein
MEENLKHPLFMLYCADWARLKARPYSIMIVAFNTRKRTTKKRVSRVGGVVLDQ